MRSPDSFTASSHPRARRCRRSGGKVVCSIRLGLSSDELRRWYAGVLDTRRGNVTVGSVICYDREQPETARMAALAGAEVILTPNACTLDDNALGSFAAKG